MKSIKNFIINQLVPQHSNHMTEHTDLESNWNYCENFYENFSLSLVKFNKTHNRTNLPSKKLFKKIFINYLNNNNEYSHFFKTQWVLSEYLDNGWKYPVQAVWNWRMRWWEIHPGYLRGLVYNLFDVKEWVAWYQPIKDKNLISMVEFKSPREVYDYFKDCHHISTHIVNYFNKPLMAICVHVNNNQNSVEHHKNIFYENIKNGINILGDDSIINRVKQEVNRWPESYIKNQITYNSKSLPSLTINKFDESNFYAGLYLFGTTITDFKNLDLIYRNNK